MSFDRPSSLRNHRAPSSVAPRDDLSDVTSGSDNRILQFVLELAAGH